MRPAFAPALLIAWSTACAAPAPAPMNPGADLDAASAFLVPEMESYRFDQFEGGISVECGRRFRPLGLGGGDWEGVEVWDAGTDALQKWRMRTHETLKAFGIDSTAGWAPAGEIGGLPVQHRPADEHSREPSPPLWYCEVDNRFAVTATRLDLLHRALQRGGCRAQLVAALDLPVNPTWRARITIARRFLRDATIDHTNPWSARNGGALALHLPTETRQAEVLGHVVESRGDSGPTSVAIITRTPAPALSFYRTVLYLPGFRPECPEGLVLTAAEEPGVLRLEIQADEDGTHVGVLFQLFGRNIGL